MRKARPHTQSDNAERGVLVDSGAWIALVRATDSHHGEADRMFRHAIARRIPLLTTNLIVAEVHRFILFHAGPRAAAIVLDRMTESPSLTIEFANAQHHRAARLWLSKLSDQRLTYTDAVSFAIMEARHCRTAMSFDHDFVVAGFSLWKWSE